MERRNLIDTEIIKTKGMITKLEQLGIDTTQYENELAIIIHKKESIGNTNNSIFTTNELEYQQLLNEIDKLQINLNNENDYFIVLNLVELIELNVDNQEKIDKYIDHIEKALRLIRNWDSSFKMNKDDFVKRFYDVIYQIIKLELIKNDDSKLLNIILSNNIDIIHLDSVIQNELNDNESLSNNKTIKEKTLSLDLQGLDNHYVDKELIRLIATSTHSDILLADIRGQLTKYNKIARDNSEKVLVLKEQIESHEETIKEVKNTVREFKRNMVKRISSLAVTITLITGLNIGHYKLAKDVVPYKKYNTRIETYDSSLETYQSTTDYLLKEEETGYVAIKVYDTPLEKRFMSSSYDGDYTYYYLASDILRDFSLEDLMQMYFEDKTKFYEFIVNYGGSIESKTSTIRKESDSSNYRSGSSIVFKLDKITLNLEKVGYYIEGEMYFQDDLTDYIKEFDYAYFILFGMAIWLATICGMCVGKSSVINQLVELSRENGDIANYRYYKRDEKNILKEKAQLLSNLKTLLLENNEVVHKFINIYEKNEHFLKVYPEIQEMYENALTVNKTLKLTK